MQPFSLPTQGTVTYSPALPCKQNSPSNQVISLEVDAIHHSSADYAVSPAARAAAAASNSKMLVHQVIFPQHVLQPQYILSLLSERSGVA